MGEISTPLTEPPPLPDELVEQILLGFPPDDPASLLRAALVCKPWWHLLSCRGFRRRFAQFHRTPPTLGFVCNCNLRDEERDGSGEAFAHFVPTSSFRPPSALSRQWRVDDARHGRVLLHKARWELQTFIGVTFAIWDPIGGELMELPILQEYEEHRHLNWSAAVLCASGDACDHLDCNRGPSQVVIVATNFNHIHACIYSSEVGAWSNPTQQLQHLGHGYLNIAVPSALVENVLYFAFAHCGILKYNLATQEMSVINAHVSFGGQHSMLTTVKGGCLGVAVASFSYLYSWTREVGPDGDAGWTQGRVIELEKLLPISALSTSLRLVGADGTGALFVLTGDGLYTIDIKTSQVKKVCKVNGNPAFFPT
ncbi:unnamed protein product [Urochloa humidicola]